jgi:hypothetical protein
MPKAVRQLTEETSECLAALAFCTGALLFWRRPVSERIRVDSASRPNDKIT